MYKEERDLLEKREIYECDMEEFSTLESSEKTIAILGDRWWPQKAKQEGDKAGIKKNAIHGKITTYQQRWRQGRLLRYVRTCRPTVGSVSSLLPKTTQVHNVHTVSPVGSIPTRVALCFSLVRTWDKVFPIHAKMRNKKRWTRLHFGVLERKEITIYEE